MDRIFELIGNKKLLPGCRILSDNPHGYLEILKRNGIVTVVDFLFTLVMPAGGFNCRLNRSGAIQSSHHSALCVIEGIEEYPKPGYNYRIDEWVRVKELSEKFILLDQLYLSDRTGVIIDSRMLRFPWSSRWKYDILRAMDYFRYSGSRFDPGMKAALRFILSKSHKDGNWYIQANHPGKVHLEMERPGMPSRINTLRALRIFKAFPQLDV